jgi:HxlR-like helix-turn-helix
MLLGARTFTEIREGVPGISKTYDLTEAGQALGPVCDALGRWGQQWIDLAPRHFDAHIVLRASRDS